MSEVDYTSHLLFRAPGTADAVRAGTKDVTRRIAKGAGCRWRVGAWARCYERDPRAGGKPFGAVRIVDVRRELLSQITVEDVAREGFPTYTRTDFMAVFREMHGLPTGDVDVWRIVFADFTPEAP